MTNCVGVTGMLLSSIARRGSWVHLRAEDGLAPPSAPTFDCWLKEAPYVPFCPALGSGRATDAVDSRWSPRHHRGGLFRGPDPFYVGASACILPDTGGAADP